MDIALTPGGDDKGSMGIPTPAKLQARLAFSAWLKNTPILRARPRSRCRATLRLRLPPSQCDAVTADRTANLALPF